MAKGEYNLRKIEEKKRNLKKKNFNKKENVNIMKVSKKEKVTLMIKKLKYNKKKIKYSTSFV